MRADVCRLPSEREFHPMGRRPRPTAMTPDEFRALLDASGLIQAAAADRLGITGATVFNWLEGRTPITDDRAALIRALIRPEGH
jgi:DNA-binding transcriptional regulator YiaG